MMPFSLSTSLSRLRGSPHYREGCGFLLPTVIPVNLYWWHRLGTSNAPSQTKGSSVLSHLVIWHDKCLEGFRDSGEEQQPMSEKPSPDVSAASWKQTKEMSGHALISKAEFPMVCLSLCLLYLFLFYFDYLLFYLRIQRKSDLGSLQRFDVPDMCCVYLCSYVYVVSVISKKGRKNEWLCCTPSPVVIGGGLAPALPDKSLDSLWT